MQHVIFAGNVVTPEMTEQLLLSGADVVKVSEEHTTTPI